MLLDPDGGWREASIEEAFSLLEDGGPFEPYLGKQRSEKSLLSILRQVHRALPRGESDVVVERLVEMALDFRLPRAVRGRAHSTLRFAALQLENTNRPGLPAPGAFEALVRIYETLAAEALEGTDGDDPFIEGYMKYRAGTWPKERDLVHVLAAVFWAEPVERGRAYVEEIYERHDPRPFPTILEERRHWESAVRAGTRPVPLLDLFLLKLSAWCRASRLLHDEPIRDLAPGVTSWVTSYVVPNPAPDLNSNYCDMARGSSGE